MALTYAELIQPSTAADVESVTLAVLELADFPVSSWQAGSAPRTLVQSAAAVAEEAWFTIAKIARGGVIVRGYSSGKWLDLAIASQYSEARKLATSASTTVRLTDHGGGPHTITVGSIVGTSNGLYQYRVTALPSGGTLALNGQLDVTVTAVAPGAAYNVAIGAINTMVTTFPTVTCSNVAAITTLGTDDELDNAAIDRCQRKWATLSTGSPVEAYEFWALTQGPGVTRVKVDDGSPDGPNTLRVYIDSAGDVTTVQNYIQPASGSGKAAAGTKATVVAATTTTIVLPLTIIVRKGYLAAATASISANLAALALDIPIGDVVRQADVIEAVMREPNSIDVTFSGTWVGTPNVTLAASAIPAFDISTIVYVEG